MPDKDPPYNTSGPRASIKKEDKDAMNAMMKARLAYEYMHGNPAVKRMTYKHNPYIFTGKEYDADWQKFVGIKKGVEGSHYMGAGNKGIIDYGNFAVPFIQENDEGDLQFHELPSITDKEAIKFDNSEDAKYFAKHYKEISPAFNKSGGSLAPIIPTYYKSKGTPIYRDITDAPPKKYNKGGLIRKLERITNSTKKYTNGGGTDDNEKYSTYSYWKNKTQPINKWGEINPNYTGSNTFNRITSLLNKEPIKKQDEYIKDSHGWDYKKTYDESGTPHYYTRKKGEESWKDLETEKNKDALAAAKALEWGDDPSWIGSPKHLAQRQYYFEEGLKDKGEWFGPTDEAERKKLIQSWYDPENKGADLIGSGEAPNIILNYAQDKDLINAHNTYFKGLGNDKKNWIYRQLLSGKWGYNPSTGAMYRLGAMGEAGKSRVIDTSKDLYTQEALAFLDDPDYFEKQRTEENKPLTDYMKDRHLVHIAPEKEWRGHAGAYPIFEEDIRQDELGNWVFNNPEEMEKRFSGDPVDLYNYGDRKVYMTDAEEEAYKKAMISNNMQAFYQHPISQLPSMIYGGIGLPNLIRSGVKNIPKFSKQILAPVLSQNIAKIPGLTINNLLTVGAGAHGIKQYTDPTSYSRQLIDQVAEDPTVGNVTELVGDSLLNLSLVAPLGIQAGQELYTSGARGINTIKNIPQLRDWRQSWNAYKTGQANFGDMFRTQSLYRFNPNATRYAFNRTDPTKNLFYMTESNPDFARYMAGRPNYIRYNTTKANAKQLNIANMQNRIKLGLPTTGSNYPQWKRISELGTEQSIANIGDVKMQNYISKIKDPKLKNEFTKLIQAPEGYWNSSLLKNSPRKNKLQELLNLSPSSKHEILIDPNRAFTLQDRYIKQFNPQRNTYQDILNQSLQYKNILARRLNQELQAVRQGTQRSKTIGEVLKTGYDD